MQLAELGFTQEELQQRVVDQCCEQVMQGFAYDEDGEAYSRPSSIYSRIKEETKKRLDEAIEAIGNGTIGPMVRERIEEVLIRDTNRYGEDKSEPITFVEYLAKRAEKYLMEKVDYKGKGKGEAGGYSWNAKGTRVAHLIHEHLHYQIEKAMKQAVGDANKTIAEGLKKACEVQLNEIASRLKVQVQTGK